MEQRFLGTGAVEPAARRELPPFVRMVAVGLARFAGVVAGAGAASVGVALLIAWWRDSDLLRAATLGLYLGGAILVAVPLLSWRGRAHSSGGYEHLEIETDAALRREWQSTLGVYVAVGVALLALGVALETIA
jgi:hypothetical protein